MVIPVKDVSDQEVIDHLKRLNSWWREGKIEDATARLKRRAYLPLVRDLVLNLSLRRAVVLLGPRRIGKTILIRHLVADLLERKFAPTSIGYVEMDHPLLRGKSLESLIRLLASASGGERLQFVFFDEIQYLKDWEQELKSIVDHSPELRVLVSGSAAAALKRKSTESGAGRFTDFLLPPLTFPEYLDLATSDPAIERIADDHYNISNIARLNRQFVDYINFGGYPELALEPAVRSDPARFVKSDIVDKVLLRDLPQLYGIQDIQELNSLFTLLAYNTGELVSPQELSQKCGIGKPTIQRYIEYLEAAFLLKRIYRIDQDGKRFQRERSFKVYLTNPAMRTGLFGPVSPATPGFGHLVETAIFAQRFHEDAILNYARWSDEREVDLVESGANLTPIEATEIKWSDQDYLSENCALVRFCKNHGITEAYLSSHTRLQTQQIGSVLVNIWPSAALAYLGGIRGMRGRIEKFRPVVAAGTNSTDQAIPAD